MKTLRFCTCLVVAAALLPLNGCADKGHVALLTTPIPVSIGNCGANPDPVKVKNGGSVTWTVPSTQPTYIVDFHGTYPTASPFMVNPGASATPHTIMAGPGCTQGCDYKYTLAKYMGSSITSCPDPVVHVDP